MKLKIKFNSLTSKRIIDGYIEKHGKQPDDAIASIDYSEIPTYIKLGKQVRRRERFSSFFESWGVALFWIIIVGGLIGWGAFSHHQKQTETKVHSEASYQRPSNSHSSSKSGIYEAESCPITTCSDGSCSSSTGRGTCSHHGGIAH